MKQIRSVQQNRDLQKIYNAIFKKYDVGSDAILDHNNHPILSKIRKGVWSELYYKRHWTLAEIAQAFDRDKSTVYRGIKSLEK